MRGRLAKAGKKTKGWWDREQQLFRRSQRQTSWLSSAHDLPTAQSSIQHHSSGGNDDEDRNTPPLRTQSSLPGTGPIHKQCLRDTRRAVVSKGADTWSAGSRPCAAVGRSLLDME